MHVLVSGRVQGVWFRDSTRQTAIRLGVRGWVRNLADGRVEATFQGDAERVAEAIEWCRHGPPMACVEALAFDEAEPTEIDDFTVGATAPAPQP